MQHELYSHLSWYERERIETESLLSGDLYHVVGDEEVNLFIHIACMSTVATYIWISSSGVTVLP